MEPRDIALLEPLRHGVAVADDRVGQLLELRGLDRSGVVERPDQVGDGRFVLLAEPAAFLLVVEPLQGRPDPFRDRVVMPELHGRREPGPFLSREPAPDGVARVERRIEPVGDLLQDGTTALVAELGVGLSQRLHEGAGRRLGPAGLLDFRREPADRLDVVMPDGLGRLFLDLEESDRLERAQVVGPDRVPRVLRGQLAQDVDSRPERGTLQGQASMTAEQVLERILLGIGRVEATPGRSATPARASGRSSGPGCPIRPARGNRASRSRRAASARTRRAGWPRIATLAARAGGTAPAADWRRYRPRRIRTPARRAGRSGRGRPSAGRRGSGQQSRGGPSYSRPGDREKRPMRQSNEPSDDSREKKFVHEIHEISRNNLK